MRLSELFIEKMQAGAAVFAALSACDRELKKRLRGRLESEDVLEYFFDCGEAGAHREELMDFWDIYRPYGDRVSTEEKEAHGIFILDCVYEVDGVFHCERCQRMLERFSPEERQREKELMSIVKGSRRAKYICFFREAGGDWREEYRLELNKSMARMETFGYFAVRQKLIEYMDTGGTAVIADRPGETGAVALTAISLGNRTFRVCGAEETEGFRKPVTGPPPAGLEEYYPKGDRDELGAIIEQGPD